eukprot:6913022-Prymnesium_polylepis.1
MNGGGLRGVHSSSTNARIYGMCGSPSPSANRNSNFFEIKTCASRSGADPDFGKSFEKCRTP